MSLFETRYDQKRHDPRQDHNQNKRPETARRFRADHQGARPGIDSGMEEHDQEQAVARAVIDPREQDAESRCQQRKPPKRQVVLGRG